MLILIDILNFCNIFYLINKPSSSKILYLDFTKFLKKNSISKSLSKIFLHHL